MIVVTGATGHVGGELVSRLAAEDRQEVRAVTRRPGAVTFPEGVEVVYGDGDDLGSLIAAFAGADGAFLMSAQPVGSAPHPTHDLHLAEAAVRAGVGRAVKLSVYSGGRGDDVIGAWHREAEAAVTTSGLPWTMLRPGRFMSNALAWAPMLARGDTVTVPFARRGAASIDPADIAAVAAAVLREEGHAGMTYQLSGPEVLTPADELRILAEVLDRPLRLVEPSVDETRAGMAGVGMAPAVIDAAIARTLDSDEGAEVLPTVLQILGRPPATFARWAARHAATFSTTFSNLVATKEALR
jgi:uncharacterized protein YbjT (DUF2867 family)